MKVHFVGVGGSGIGGVARLAETLGYEVSGCDKEENSSYGFKFWVGHDGDHIKEADLVVTSPALFYTVPLNPEIETAKSNGRLITWQEFLGKTLLKDKKLICIAGTHGKSTTTAMVGKMLTDAGMDPIVVLGAIVPEWGGTSRYGKGDYAVLEADEFNNNFLNYYPDIAVINNIEFDHPDFFKNFDEVKESFSKFKNNLKGMKILFTEKDSEGIKFNLKVYGEHNQKNANMAYLVGKTLGIEESEIRKSLESFSGIGRRMELLGERSGVKVFDDYAHHPTAIRTTINGLKKEFPHSRIIAVLEPHGFARTKTLLKEYKGVFEQADKVLIGPIFAARDKADETVSPEIVAKVTDHKNALGAGSIDEILENIGKDIDEGDVILVMGAGKSYQWARKIYKNLPVSFKDLTTFRVGGKIKKYFEVKTRREIDSAIMYARENKLPLMIVGSGSDLLVSDKVFQGVVVKYIRTGISYDHGQDGTFVTGYAGGDWDNLVEYAVNNNLSGMECLSGIPGTVGAAPIQNIGAYGQELKDTFYKLTAYDLETRKFKTFYKEDCKFDYRESIFKTKEFWQKYLIIKVTFKLTENGNPSITYDSLKTALEQKGVKTPSLKIVRSLVLEIRKGKFEDPKLIGNAGSFFKNPVIAKEQMDKLLTIHSDVKYFETAVGYKVFAGWIIEAAGWKGAQYKTAAVSSRHALILINPGGNAKAEDVYDLSEKIIADVKEKFDITLEREVQLINF